MSPVAAETELSLGIDEIVQFTGETDVDMAASSVASAGDVNGDGYTDFLVGATGVDLGNGAAYLVYGQSSNYASASLGTTVKFSAESSMDFAGNSVASAGDVNGDGYDDILIGAQANDAVATTAGAAYLLYGKADNHTSASLDTAIRFTGEALNNSAGTSVASAGDVNGDGYDDILIGAPGNSDAGSGAGAAYLLYGKADNHTSASLSTAVQLSGETGDSAGTSVASAGDVNGDGYDDILIGATSAASGNGAAYLLYGKADNHTSASLSTAVQFSGEENTDTAGNSVASAGDVNGDGYDDILVSAMMAESMKGGAYLLHGKADNHTSASLSTGIQFLGLTDMDMAGDDVASAGDVNGDGYDDILVGSTQGGGMKGVAYLLYAEESDISITNNNSSINTIECSVGTFADPGATATDEYEDSSLSVSSSGTVTEEIVGSYPITYTAVNVLSVASSAIRTVTVQDTTAPTISITNNTVEYNIVECGVDTFSDPGATATDTCDSSITPSALGTVSEETAGTYSVVYSATDDSDNPADAATRSVLVQDTTSPTITLTGESSVTVSQGDTYTDAGATATDSCEGDLTSSIQTTSTVDTSVVGEYSVTYTLTDAAENPATAVVRTVNVIAAVDDSEDEQSPVSSLGTKKKGKVKVSYEDGSSSTFSVFTKGKPKASLASDDERVIVVNSKGKLVRIIDAFSGEVLASKKIRAKKQAITKIKVIDFYSKKDSKDEVLVATKKKRVLKITVLTLHDTTDKLSKKTTKIIKPFRSNKYKIVRKKKQVRIKVGKKIKKKYKVTKRGRLKKVKK